MRKALVVGIDNYPSPLRGCIADAKEIAPLLAKHDNSTPNFSLKTEYGIQKKVDLLKLLNDLFSGDCDTSLFYFAGHGLVNALGGYIVTPDSTKYDEGVSMDDILKLANQSQCKNRIIILDCCHSGTVGDTKLVQQVSLLANGLSILTACRDMESSCEVNGHGVFTNLLIAALQGGAADLRGHITPGSIYSYIDQALGPWDQRPVFKTNVTQFISVREAAPPIPIEMIRKLKDYFAKPTDRLSLNPSYEYTNSPDIAHVIKEPYATQENVTVLKVLQRLVGVGLVRPIGAEHMYYAAMKSKECELTPLGHHYWRLVGANRI